TDVIAEFGGMDVVWVRIANSLCDRAHERILRRIWPRLEVVAAHPNDVGMILETVTQELSVRVRFRYAIVIQNAEPTARFNWIEQNDHSELRRDIENLSRAIEVHRVRCGKIALRSEGRNSVEGCPVVVAGCVTVAQEVDP